MLRRGLLALSLLAFSACDDGGPPTQGFEVAGFVTDGETGRGIGGATVVFRSDTLYEESTTTEGNGRYELAVDSDTPFGEIIASAEGYSTRQVTVFFDVSSRRIDVELPPE